MDISNQIAMCSEHYSTWKNHALATNDIAEIRKSVERAFFWLELQSAFVVLHAIEQSKSKDPELKKKLIIAKTNLSRKLADYAKEIWSEMV